MASKNVGEDEVLACPECDKTPVVTNSPGARNSDQFSKYRCTTCNAHFDEPKVREDRGGPGIRDDSLAAKLEDAKPGDLVTDGGRSDGETDRGPKEFECIVCGAATYENGPCHSCGSEPFDDGGVEFESGWEECRSAVDTAEHGGGA